MEIRLNCFNSVELNGFAKLKNIKLTPKKETNEFLESIGLPDLKDGASLFNLVKR